MSNVAIPSRSTFPRALVSLLPQSTAQVMKSNAAGECCFTSSIQEVRLFIKWKTRRCVVAIEMYYVYLRRHNRTSARKLAAGSDDYFSDIQFFVVFVSRSCSASERLTLK